MHEACEVRIVGVHLFHRHRVCVCCYVGMWKWRSAATNFKWSV